ncbi:MAG TPA: TRIC cation channel family protein [Bdellovibrionales bacterium]|nr:TRIC cation channel family protein [Bdellovibrionales bacterium]
MEGLSEFRSYVDLSRPYFEYLAVATGAVSGALHARKRSFDFVGVVIIGLVSGLGGGLIRDSMLSMGPALALRIPGFLITAMVAALLGSMFGSFITDWRRTLWVIDTIALGLFAVVGLQRAEAAGLQMVPSIFLGVVTCVGGGLIRDVLCRETPILLLPGRPYTIVALFSGVVYMIALRGFAMPTFTAELLAICGAFFLRLIIEWQKWVMPAPDDLRRLKLSRWSSR